MKTTLRQVMLVFSTALALAGTASGETMKPIGVSGFDVDLIVEASATTLESVNCSLDYSTTTPVAARQYAYYEKGLLQDYQNDGLSSGVLVSQCDSNTTFKLATFTQNNALLIDANLPTDDVGNTTPKAGTLTLDLASRYSKLAVFGVSGGSGKTLNYTLTYENNSTSTGTVFMGDWFSPATNVAVKERARARFRVGTDSSWILDPDTIANPNGANIYQADITNIDPTKKLVSISFSGTVADGGGTAIFALSGATVPEPASVTLLGLGAGGLLAYAWRKRK